MSIKKDKCPQVLMRSKLRTTWHVWLEYDSKKQVLMLDPECMESFNMQVNL